MSGDVDDEWCPYCCAGDTSCSHSSVCVYVVLTHVCSIIRQVELYLEGKLLLCKLTITVFVATRCRIYIEICVGVSEVVN